MKSKILPVFWISACVALIAGCNPKPLPYAPNDARPTPFATRPRDRDPGTGASTTRVEADGESRVATSGLGTGSAERPPADRGVFKDVFFDFDQFEIREDQRAALEENARLLTRRPGAVVIVEGHCDDRGTAQYNMALGEKRANAVRDFLTALGIEASRVKTVSYGKERPIVPGTTDQARALNRRGHFVTAER